MDEGLIGEIRLFAGPSSLEKWLFCEGQQLSTRQYAALFSIIQYQYGGNPAQGVFHLPNLAPLTEAASGQGDDKIATVRYVICYDGYYPARP